MLDAGMGLITDGERPVALAGVMGGMDSEIEDDTVDVMVESACFNAGRTSHTSRDLSLISDASIRFERQVDETGCVDVANVTCALIEGDRRRRGRSRYVDVFPAPKSIDSIKLRLARVHAICGADIEPDFIERSLTRLGCTVERDGEDFMVTPPSFRPDLPREVDLIEEVLRLWGMGRVTATIPAAKNHIGGLTREQKAYPQRLARSCAPVASTRPRPLALPPRATWRRSACPPRARGCPVVLNEPAGSRADRDASFAAAGPAAVRGGLQRGARYAQRAPVRGRQPVPRSRERQPAQGDQVRGGCARASGASSPGT